ncbi:hypothetical protein BDV34DRAFT_191943 [Aspergillus parasiticus]|uniref:Uncharacterized protein n=1 Tax=Aspergillus parasiticus TaxID=5067 RepID=A0A5N6DR09_ASPPA|nr:hypothetical protein BDV34DRAFT_191943 [Aspergillus parasiticus]
MFQAKFEQIYLASKECLGLEEEFGRPDNPVSSTNGPAGVPGSCLTPLGVAAHSGSNQDVPVVEQGNNICKTFAKNPSIFTGYNPTIF